MNKIKVFSIFTACLFVLCLTRAAYAQTNVAGKNLAEKLAWLVDNANTNGSYIVEINANESIHPFIFSFDEKSNITITLRGIGRNRTISLSTDDYMFWIRGDVTLILDNNVTLRGRNTNNVALVYVDSGGTLVMNNGSAITGNTSSSVSSGSGVHVGGGTFIMNGGAISGNTAYSGGGVGVLTGTFIMNGGTISGNTSDSGGGGVSVFGTFTMNGGTISGNTAKQGHGGGVYVVRGTFTKTGGTITGYASDRRNGNVARFLSVQNELGYAVFVYSRSIGTKGIDTTVGPQDNLFVDTENGIYSGAWDNYR